MIRWGAWLARLLRRQTPERRTQPTEDQRKAARRAAIEYANFMAYEGDEQSPIDEALL